jgi:D-alanine-D-alanine ligase
MTIQTILLIFGGESSEHDVSLASARNVYAAIDGNKYDVKLCYIDQNGKWWLVDKWPNEPSEHGGVQLLIAPGAKSFVTMPGSDVLHPDVVLPILHGKNGEDGTIQGVFELMHLPYVGCDVLSSALCMDKVRLKNLLRGAAPSIRVTPDIIFTKNDDYQSAIRSQTAITDKLGDGPWFVKPSRAGSSVGVTKVYQLDVMITAIENALKHDDTALVEKAIKGRELEVAILGTPPHHKASGVGEIVPGADFYDYDDKYSDSSASKVIIDADLSQELKDAIQEHARAAYRAAGCSGLARVDFLLDEEGNPYLNEINTLPGFTNISMYPKLWRQQGMYYPELIEALIDDALKNR